MAELDNLLGSRISLITIQDVRYDGVLFSINAQESSIVLRDVRTLGTEDRVTDPAKKMAPSDQVLPFVSFPGSEIKDLFVHEAKANEAQPPKPPAAEQKAQRSPQRAPKSDQPPRPPQQREGGGGRGRGRDGQQGGRGGQGGRGSQNQHQNQHRENRENRPTAAAGTGNYLLHRRERKGDGTGAEAANMSGEFDFAENLTHFNKEEVLAKVATEGVVNITAETKYKKEDFFDSLSNDAAGPRPDAAPRRNMAEERALNQDTFGAIALQSNYYHGGRGRGRGGRGRGGRGYRGRGRGRGSEAAQS